MILTIMLFHFSYLTVLTIYSFYLFHLVLMVALFFPFDAKLYFCL